jgi:hypothetical protein
VIAAVAFFFVRSLGSRSCWPTLGGSVGIPGDSTIEGDTIAVGAPYDDLQGLNLPAGSAYIFVRSGTTWTQQAKLIRTNFQGHEKLGVSIAISNDTVVVGAAPTRDLGLARERQVLRARDLQGVAGPEIPAEVVKAAKEGATREAEEATPGRAPGERAALVRVARRPRVARSRGTAPSPGQRARRPIRADAGAASSERAHAIRWRPGS